jgi:small subunit ribosomal protein S9
MIARTLGGEADATPPMWSQERDMEQQETQGLGTVAAPAPAPRAEADRGGFWWGTGRRKTAVARVRVKSGSGKFVVNERPFDQYFTEVRDRMDVMAPVTATKMEGKVDIHVNATGGGFAGQAGATLLGVARALLKYDPALEPILRENGFLTRDPREVERKKYGQAGARKRFQFSKR